MAVWQTVEERCCEECVAFQRAAAIIVSENKAVPLTAEQYERVSFQYSGLQCLARACRKRFLDYYATAMVNYTRFLRDKGADEVTELDRDMLCNGMAFGQRCNEGGDRSYCPEMRYDELLGLIEDLAKN